MEEQFEATLTGSDSLIDGIVNRRMFDGVTPAYEFTSIDGSLVLTIIEDNGHWIRVAGTEPYLSGWVDELAEQLK